MEQVEIHRIAALLRNLDFSRMTEDELFAEALHYEEVGRMLPASDQAKQLYASYREEFLQAACFMERWGQSIIQTIRLQYVMKGQRTWSDVINRELVRTTPRFGSRI